MTFIFPFYYYCYCYSSTYLFIFCYISKLDLVIFLLFLFYLFIIFLHICLGRKMCVVCFVFIFRFSVLILEGEVRSVLSGRRERERGFGRRCLSAQGQPSFPLFSLFSPLPLLPSPPPLWRHSLVWVAGRSLTRPGLTHTYIHIHVFLGLVCLFVCLFSCCSVLTWKYIFYLFVIEIYLLLCVCVCVCSSYQCILYFLYSHPSFFPSSITFPSHPSFSSPISPSHHLL